MATACPPASVPPGNDGRILTAPVFSSVDVWFHYFNFASLVAIK
jgi:hypothetical protein